jgi:hypothetical protein
VGLPAPVALRPPPPTAGACPRDGSPLDVAALRFPGARFVVEGTCPACGHRYVQDLPTAHAIVYPSTLDLDTGEAHGQWFEPELREGHAAPDVAPVALRVEIRRAGPRALVLNALDPVYGHALLKLLNADRLAAEVQDGEGLVVVVPAALAHLVPAAAAEAWVVDEPLSRLRGWLADLDARIAAELERFTSARLAAAAPHPHPSTFDLSRYTGPLEPRRFGEPSIVLCLRPDRFWGRSAHDQRKRYERLADALREAFPAAGIAALGLVASAAIPARVTDLTAERPDAATEAAWLAALAGADLAVGVHGSNMLLPSGLARSTLELLPEDRYGNAFQATLATDVDPLATLYRHRTLYGAADLRDVAPERVSAIAFELLVGGPHFRARLLGPVAGQRDVPPRPGEPLFGTPPTSRWQSPPG